MLALKPRSSAGSKVACGSQELGNKLSCKAGVGALEYVQAVRKDTRLKISQKGLYALQAIMTLGRRYGSETVRIRDIALDSDLPEKFLELILLELKNARIVESVRGAKGGYRLRRAPAEIKLSEIIRLVDGPLAPFGDADQLRSLIITDPDHRALYGVFLEVRDAAAKILESTSVADIVGGSSKSRKKSSSKKKAKKGPLLSIVHEGAKSK
jgi:Rrf2 family protein